MYHHLKILTIINKQKLFLAKIDIIPSELQAANYKPNSQGAHAIPFTKLQKIF